MFESASSGGVWTRRATAGTVLLIAVALATSMTAAVLSSPAWAATLTVETASDRDTNDQCSLREAIINANGDDQSGSPDCPAGGGADRIDFGLGDAPVTITLASQLPAVTDGEGLIVDGEDARIAVSGNDAARVFEVGSGAELVLRNLTLEKGLAHLDGGGAILNRGNLTMSGSTLRGNGAGSGGGLHNSGTATVSNSTLSGNVASGSGGGIHNLGTLTVSSTTLFDNSAGQSGGGIEHAGGSARLKNTIVAGSTSGGDCHKAVTAITDSGYNLDSDNTCGLTTAKRSRPGANPRLAPLLADNGGPSPTHALLEGSPAVDKGDSFGAAADQRGLPRPTDLGEFRNARGGDGSDIGAYEMVKCSGDVVNAAGTVVGNPRGEVLKGTAGDDTIFGLGGNDTIFGGGGNDEVCSGKGNDALYGGDGADKLLGGEGKDKLQGGDGDDRLEGLRGDDRLDTKDGVRANDAAYGGTGQDTCRRTDPGDKKASCR